MSRWMTYCAVPLRYYNVRFIVAFHFDWLLRFFTFSFWLMVCRTLNTWSYTRQDTVETKDWIFWRRPVSISVPNATRSTTARSTWCERRSIGPADPEKVLFISFVGFSLVIPLFSSFVWCWISLPLFFLLFGYITIHCTCKLFAYKLGTLLIL